MGINNGSVSLLDEFIEAASIPPAITKKYPILQNRMVRRYRRQGYTLVHKLEAILIVRSACSLIGNIYNIYVSLL
jgi:hypothetical protein